MRLAADVDVTVGNLAAAVDTQQHCQPPRRASDALLHLTTPADGITKVRSRIKVGLRVEGPLAAARKREQSKGSYCISKEPGIVPAHRLTGTYAKFLVQARFGPSAHEAGDVAAPTQSSTQKAASHLNRLGRTAWGVDHMHMHMCMCMCMCGERVTDAGSVTYFTTLAMLGEITKEQGRAAGGDSGSYPNTTAGEREVNSTLRATSWEHGKRHGNMATWRQHRGNMATCRVTRKIAPFPCC